MSACAGCGAAVTADDQFCESCGAALGTAGTPREAAGISAPARVSAATGSEVAIDSAVTAAHEPGAVDDRCACGGTFDRDGWCDRCGRRLPNDRDHLVVTISAGLAAVSDKGRHHPRNEDAFALAESGGRSVAVVCDGVSSTTDPETAAVAAAEAARDVLSAASPPETRSPAARVEYYSDVMTTAAHEANDAACTAARKVGGQNPPSCTFAAAIVDGDLVVAGWVGDSRVYWLGDDRAALQLSIDDSWVSDQVDHGMPREQAEADPLSHSITRWLGADAPDPTPTCGSFAATGAGWVLVCSDGLWNYCSGASDLSALVEKFETGDPTELASRLVDWANEQGGHDNITAALVRVGPHDIPEPAAESATTITDAGSPQTRSA